MRKSFLMGCGALGAYTAAEASKGRYMRAPEGHGDDGGFAEFAAAGEVEVSKPAIESNVPDEPEPKPAPKRGPPKPAATPKPAAEKPDAGKPGEGDDDADPDDQDEDDDDADEDEDEEAEKAKKKEGHLKRLKRERMQARQEARDLKARLAVYDELAKNGVLPVAKTGVNSADIGEAPNPSDLDKYPLGHLDDRYIEDKLDWLATQKAAGQADAVLQRQQEAERTKQANDARDALLEKVDDLSTRGSEHYDDFQEAVVEAGMRGDWRLEQPTFEAAHEADNGAQILYELSQDKAEAKRVAALTPFQQLKFVIERDAEIGKTKQPRRIPRAGEPPATQTRGANSRTRINPATESLDDFERAWAADAKGK